MADQAPSDNDDEQQPRDLEAGKKAEYEREFVAPPPKHLQSAFDCKAKAPCDDDADRKQTEKTGYECEFVKSPPKQRFQSECSICLQILREPYIVDCCGYSFCADCIERVAKEGKPCPLCNVSGFTSMTNKGLKRTLNALCVYCPHRLRGCEWAGELGKLDQHLNSDSKAQRQLEGCPFEVIECLHCKEGIRRDKIAGHQLEHCPQRPYTCEYCAEYNSTFEDVAHSHWPECLCFLLPCPNECTPSGSGIQCQNIYQHVKEECTLTVVKCELHLAGCKMTLSRKDMVDHMKEGSIAHIFLLAAENRRLSMQLVEREEQMVLLIQQNTDLEDKIIELKEAQRQALQTQQELTQKVTSQGKQLTQTKQELTQTKQELTQLCDQHKLKLYSEMQRDVVPVTFEVAGFRELKKNDTTWFSRPFYSGMGGYKMCLGVEADGNGVGSGTHVSVYTCIMRGEFNSRLKWPFQGIVTIQLLNQLEDEEHFTDSYNYTDTTPIKYKAQVTEGERCRGWGKPEFFHHSELGLSAASNRQYLKDDCLIYSA